MEKQYVEKANAYFKHQLSPDEQVKFEKEIEADPGLRQFMEEYQLAIDAIDHNEEAILRDKFSTWRKNEKKTSIRRLIVYSSIAASIAVLFGFFISTYFSGPKTYQKLAYQNYHLPESPGASMGDSQLHWNKGIDAFKAKDYQIAIQEWDQIPEPDPEINYFLGHAYFNVKNYKKASEIFNVLSKQTSIYSFPSDWYLLLSYLSEDNIEKYNQQSDKILKNKEHPFYNDALKLKNEVENIY
jgi:tetratricopeptide (TPR) repeat protein